MADAVTSQILVDGDRNFVLKLTNLSDGTGESAVAKTVIANLHPAPTLLRLEKIQGNIYGMEVELLWKATTNVNIMNLGPGLNIDQCFEDVGGIQNTKASGYTGDMLLTTSGQSNGSFYELFLHFKKKYASTAGLPQE
jgi:hypothetical protein